MDVLEAIQTRRSIGKLDQEIPSAVIEDLVTEAILAPNHHMTQPWHFTVVSGEMREKLGEFWGRVTAEERGLSGEERESWIAREKNRPLRAPVLIFVSCRLDPDPVRAVEDHSATAAAVQNLLLAAWGRGLGTMWRTGDMAYHPKVKEFLGLEPTDKILAIVYLGQPAMTPPKGRPRNLKESLTWFQPSVAQMAD